MLSIAPCALLTTKQNTRDVVQKAATARPRQPERRETKKGKQASNIPVYKQDLHIIINTSHIIFFEKREIKCCIVIVCPTSKGSKGAA